MKIFNLILLLVCLNSFGQCADYDKLDLGGTYINRTDNYIPFDPNISDTIKYCCDLKKVRNYTDVILSKAKDYIVKRAGAGFYSHLDLHDLEVNYPDPVKIRYENPDLYNLEKYNVTYWIKYTYSKDGYQYAFGLYFDKVGNFISENMFPDISKNPGFENFSDPCNALEKVKKHRKFKNKMIAFIELAYLDEVNSFCWLVEEKHLPTKLGVSHYKILSFYINANTGKLEKIAERDQMSIACGAQIITRKD